MDPDYKNLSKSNQTILIKIINNSLNVEQRMNLNELHVFQTNSKCFQMYQIYSARQRKKITVGEKF